MDLSYGIYEQVINQAISESLKKLESEGAVIDRSKIDSSESETILARYMQHALEYGLRAIKEKFKSSESSGISAEVEACNNLLEVLSKVSDENDIMDWRIGKDAEQLLSVWDKQCSILKKNDARPKTSIAISSLFTGNRKEITLSDELEREIKTADEVDFLVSFIKFTGIRKIIESLKEFTDNGGKLRILTTTYMGVTEAYAIKCLSELKNTEIKISYDTNTTRLHAKSYIFKRNNGYTTAFVGSSNLSGAAITDGMEWNLKVTNQDMSQVIIAINATFDTYWNSKDFELFSSKDLARLNEAAKHEKNRNSENLSYLFDIKLHPFQEEILGELDAERKIHNRYRNLIVAATGTGKTVISAFDYKRFISEHPGSKNRLLYIVHRKEILEKSLITYRAVLKDPNFGELFVGDSIPSKTDYIFMSIQTFTSKRFDTIMNSDYYDYIVVDETHHGAAASYIKLLTHFQPKILLGLTATPERADGLDILGYFDNTIASEIRLPEAINRELLVPFQYFGVTDPVDLSAMKFQHGKYVDSELEEKYVGNENRVQIIVDALHKYQPYTDEIKGLGFCVSKKHAEYMAKKFNEVNISSIALTADSDQEIRNAAQTKLRNGEIKFIFTVDLYNEGVDIPSVNTELMLRPTESLTVFIQQLGRGLRRDDCPKGGKSKTELTVLDFVGQANKNYHMYENKLNYLTAGCDMTVKSQIEQGFCGLPMGCYIKIEPIARDYIFDNIKQTTNNLKKLLEYVKSYTYETGNVLEYLGFLKYYNLHPEDIYSKKITFVGLCKKAELIPMSEDEETFFSSAFLRLSSIDSRSWIQAIKELLIGRYSKNAETEKMVTMLYYSFYSVPITKTEYSDIWKFIDYIRSKEDYSKELISLISLKYSEIRFVDEHVELGFDNVLDLHCSYTRDQILAGFGKSTSTYVHPLREGVLYLPEHGLDILLINLNKSEKDFSPTTMYEDYAINEKLFNWQSQNGTSENSKTGQRYRNSKSNVVLFVREKKGLPYIYLGKGHIISHHGSKPMSIVWELEKSMPQWVLEKSSVIRN